MVEQTRPTPNTTTLQAGPVELIDDGTLSDVTTREARIIGRQLARIGDELNQRWAHRLPDQRLLQPLDRTNIFIRARVYRRYFLTEGRGLRHVLALAKLWLNPLIYSQPVWVSNLCPTGQRWTTGLLVSTALMATAAVCVALWELKKD
ncbi:bcl-2-interacting killer [Sardina pilchardus]|uniref:bcl-2-interacting killer n=1 Tax=Sardina pilchardus TaxID=27697 RepID=UPI002E13E4BD